MSDHRLCDVCGASFAPRNTRHRYCSRKCGWKASNDKRSKKTARSCLGCGKDISGQYAKMVYCSNACRRWVARGNTSPRILNTHCQRCGKVFERLRAGKKYCSVTCKKMAGNLRNGPSNAERYQRERDKRLAYAIDYARSHPEVGQATKRRRRAAVQSNGLYRFNGKDWKRCMDRFGGKCFYCGEKKRLSMDHVVPVSRGGSHGAGNIVPACVSCNASKNSSFVVEWRMRKRMGAA